MEKVAISLEKIDLDYDEEADVLYISFGNEIVGITITDFKARTLKK